MAEFIATCPAGLERVAGAAMEQDLADIRILQTYDGLLHFRYSGGGRQLKSLPYLNNVYFVMKAFRQGESLEEMVQSCGKRALPPLIRKGTFRVRFTEANRFVGVPKVLSEQAEQQVIHHSELVPDRLSPRTEIWFIRRTEGVGFCAQLLWRRRVTEKDLPPGKLRPEFAHLMCRAAELPAQAIVADPFAGYGGLVEALQEQGITVLASDLDAAKAEALHGVCADARHLTHIADASVDAVVTDPPWGLYEEIQDIRSFYREVLQECRRILKPDGQVVLVTACKQEIEEAAPDAGFTICTRIDTLVNGKKAAIYRMKGA